MTEMLQNLPPSLRQVVDTMHPYARYGVAAAFVELGYGKTLSQIDEPMLRLALQKAIEYGLSRFRMETDSNPTIADELLYRPIDLETLRNDASLIQSPGLAAKGKYLFPSIITTDGSAKNTFAEVEKLHARLDAGDDLLKMVEMKRSFAPVMGEVNNGKSEKQNLKGSLLEAAASAVSTITPDKPAMMTGGSNRAIYPDLPLEELIEFVQVFQRFVQNGGGEPMQRKISRVSTSQTTTAKRKTTQTAAPKSEYRRPPIHEGNFPDAPRDGAFGAVGLLAAMGYWAQRADEYTALTLHVLESLKNRPMYILSVASSAQARFSHYVVDLAKTGELQYMIREFYYHVRPYAVYDQNLMRRDTPLFAHLYRAMNRFLQEFDAPSFRDLLSTRAEYPPAISKLFEVYFMQSETDPPVPQPIVASARALGEWINRCAFFIADAETEDVKTDKEGARRKAKAKVLVEIESLILSARRPSEMGGRVLRTIGQESRQDAPNEAKEFLDYMNAELMPLKVSQYLLLTYMRVRWTPSVNEGKAVSSKAADPYKTQGDGIDFDNIPSDDPNNEPNTEEGA